MESMMAGTPTIATVLGGLQDQMGFKIDGREITTDDFTAEVGSNSNKQLSTEHGEWTYPLWPNHSLQGSVPTPYIYDSRPTIEDITSGLEFWKNQSKSERIRKGISGRNWAIENNFTEKGMNELWEEVRRGNIGAGRGGWVTVSYCRDWSLNENSW